MEFSKVETGSLPDSGETIQISPLALLKMLKHGRAGIPVEVMGLILGRRIDDYTTEIVDVYAMPQTGTGVTVESVDPVYQTKMNEMLREVNRKENVIGWYHSHPGFGCWLSHIDMTTQKSFEQMDKNAIAVVIDPIQSVRGKVVIDAFRLINSQMSMFGVEPRQITSNIGFLQRGSAVAIVHGLGKYYYSFRITYKVREIEEKLLCNLKKKTWAENLQVKADEVDIKTLNKNVESYVTNCEQEDQLEGKELQLHKIGRVDFRRKLFDRSESMIEKNTTGNLLLAIHSYIFSK